MVIRYNIDDEYVCPRCNLNLYYDEFEEEYYCPICSYIVDARHNLLQASISQSEHNSYSQFLGSVIIKNYKNNEEYIKRLYEADKYKITLTELMEEHINPILIHIGLTEWRTKIIDMVLERVRNVDKLRYIDEKTGKAYLNNNDDLPYAVYFVILYIIFTNKLEYKVRSAIRNNLNIQEKGSRLEDIILNLVLTEFPLRTKKKGIKTDIPYFLIPVLLKKAKRLGAKKAYEIVYKLKEKMKMKKEEKEKEELCYLHDYFDVKNAVVLDKEYIMLYKFGIIFTYPSDPFEESMIFFNKKISEYTTCVYSGALMKELHYTVMDLRQKGKVTIDLSVFEAIDYCYDFISMSKNVKLLSQLRKFFNQDIPSISDSIRKVPLDFTDSTEEDTSDFIDRGIADFIEEGIIETNDGHFIIPKKDFFITLLEEEFKIQRKSIRYSKANKNKNHKRTRRKKEGLRTEEEKIKDKG